jgi:hypothetical protein
MFLDPFHSSNENLISISAEQASSFAKSVSNDFNPIHDVDSKRFCVPGDLLFALVLQRYGLSKKMSFNFSGMVQADTQLVFPHNPGNEFEILDSRGKCYLQVSRNGESTDDLAVIEQLIKRYVFFSGQNFPYILQPLMEQKNVMINPQRPLAIYHAMSLQFDTLNLNEPVVELAKTSLEVNGKRGDGEFNFRLMNGEQVVGCGVKKIILSGLREYEKEAMDKMVADYLRWASQS